MSLLNDALGAAGSAGFDINALAAKVGLSEDQVKMVMAAIAKFTNQPGDTAEQVAGDTGVEKSKIEQILASVGGEGAAAKLGEMLGGSGGGLGGMLGKF